MSPHFTFWSFIIPYIVFIFSLYLAAVPKRLSSRTHKSRRRIIQDCLGAAFGLFISITVLVETRNDMTDPESSYFLLGLAILSWCVYSLFTNHSNLSKGKKIAKFIIYWLITNCFLSASHFNKLTRWMALCLNLIFAIIAYYTVCDREIKERPSKNIATIFTKKKKIFTKKKRVNLKKMFHSLHQYVRRITIFLNPIWQFCANNKKNILIIVIIIIILWLLPFYAEYFINNSGLRSLLKHKVSYY